LIRKKERREGKKETNQKDDDEGQAWYHCKLLFLKTKQNTEGQNGKVFQVST
jgi:hypothetical protein